MYKFEKERALKILDLLEFKEGECGIAITIERYGMPELTLRWDLKPYEERKEIYDFFEYFENSRENKIYFRDTTIYIRGNSHVFTLLLALISQNPKRIIYKKELLDLNNNPPANWLYLHKRAQKRNIEIREI